MKTASKIVEYGKLKAFPNLEKRYFIGVDIETVDNNLFLIGAYSHNNYKYALTDFAGFFFDNLIYAVQNNLHIATWTRYDNTQIIKLLFNYINNVDTVNKIIERIGKLSATYDKENQKYIEPPLLTIKHNGFYINVDNVIRDCIMFRIVDQDGDSKIVWSYNIKNLYANSDLVTACKDSGLSYYSKISDDSHIIDVKKFSCDSEYKNKVLLSNELDSRVAQDLASKIQDDFFELFNMYPHNLVSAGSLARSSVIAMSRILDISTKRLNVNSILRKDQENHAKLLDYSMRAYHGGKIDSYVIGYTKQAYIIDITSAYPSVLRELKSFNYNQVIYKVGKPIHAKYNYMFVRCNLNIKSDKFSTPFIIQNPLNNNSNLNAYGYIKDIILTKYEYQFVLDNLDFIDIEYIDYFYLVNDGTYTLYRPIVDKLFNQRMEYRKAGKTSLANLIKTIINSLYGINYELNEVYDSDLSCIGFRAGDFFNPIIASHITGATRTQLANMNNVILKRGGKILLNMTDSIIFEGTSVDDLLPLEKTLGEFERAETINDVLILGSGRYEYVKDLKYVYKTRGFTATTSKGSYYTDILNNGGKIKNKGFVTTFKSTLSRTIDDVKIPFTYQDIGLIYDDEYDLDPFNLGGKRLIASNDKKIDITTDRIDTKQIYLDKSIWEWRKYQNEFKN